MGFSHMLRGCLFNLFLKTWMYVSNYSKRKEVLGGNCGMEIASVEAFSMRSRGFQDMA